MFCIHAFDSAGAGIEPTQLLPAGGVALLFTGLLPLAEDDVYFSDLLQTQSQKGNPTAEQRSCPQGYLAS
jgi:hypothetical protein